MLLQCKTQAPYLKGLRCLDREPALAPRGLLVARQAPHGNLHPSHNHIGIERADLRSHHAVPELEACRLVGGIKHLTGDNCSVVWMAWRAGLNVQVMSYKGYFVNKNISMSELIDSGFSILCKKIK